MYNLSVSINITTVTDATFPSFLEKLRAVGAKRVFFCGLGAVYTDSSLLSTAEDEVRMKIKAFKDEGFETGVWISGFGHGTPFMVGNCPSKEMYTPITGIDGNISAHGFCPRDPKFAADYTAAVAKIATLSPDIIFIDDDCRFNLRSYYMGCFCPIHLKEYYERIGEEIPREQLEKLMLTGGKNKYRTEYMKMMGDSLTDFARSLRAAVDTVDPSIRMGIACVSEHWDVTGVDAIGLAKVFAGSTRPFTRTFGAPYHDPDIINIIETTRAQFSWAKDSDVEIFAEGDTHPRYRCLMRSASRTLELFDFALRACGDGDGILAYIFCYVNSPGYDPVYADRYAKNAPIQKGIGEIFEGKTPVGIEVVHTQRTAENRDLPSEIEANDTFNCMIGNFYSPATELLSPLSIPTAYRETEYPLLIVGENAKYVDLSTLKRGALIDVEAAKILTARGVDVGFISAERRTAKEEFFPQYGERIAGVNNFSLQRVVCKEGAEVLSYLRPDDSPAFYRYENASGERFAVIALDKQSIHHRPNPTFSANFCRQAQLFEQLEWLGRKKLPAVCRKYPNLYLMTSRDENSMAVEMINIHIDEATTPEVTLDREYSSIRFVSGSGRLSGNKVLIDDIPPYGFVAFEVKR